MDVNTRDFNNLQAWLDTHLNSRQMSVEQLANRSGLSRATIYFYMQDKNRPSANAMARICRVLGVPVEEGMKQFTPRKPGRPAGARNRSKSNNTRL